VPEECGRLCLAPLKSGNKICNVWVNGRKKKTKKSPDRFFFDQFHIRHFKQVEILLNFMAVFSIKYNLFVFFFL
jgi:hypothetical protein